MNRLYDATLLDITDSQLTISLFIGETEQFLTLPCAGGSCNWLRQQLGKTGIAEQYANNDGYWRFIPYLDETLRRSPDLDCHYGNERHLGWQCTSLGAFLAPAHITPGAKGAFIPDETELLTLRIPPEFADLCACYHMIPETVLCGFIADAAELQNFVAAPRADGYSSNGSDERMLANDYLDRAYAMRCQGGQS